MTKVVIFFKYWNCVTMISKCHTESAKKHIHSECDLYSDIGIFTYYENRHVIDHIFQSLTIADMFLDISLKSLCKYACETHATVIWISLFKKDILKSRCLRGCNYPIIAKLVFLLAFFFNWHLICLWLANNFSNWSILF